MATPDTEARGPETRQQGCGAAHGGRSDWRSITPEAGKRLEEAIAAKIPRPPAEEPGLSLAQKLAAAQQRLLAARMTKEPTTT